MPVYTTLPWFSRHVGRIQQQGYQGHRLLRMHFFFISTFHLRSATFVWEVKVQTNNRTLTTTTKLRTTLPEKNSENSLPISYKYHPLLLSDWEMHTPNSPHSSYTHTSMSIHCQRQRQCFPKPWPIRDSPAPSMCMSSFGTGVTVIPSLRSTVRPSLSCIRSKQQISESNRHVLCRFLQQRSDCRAFLHIMHIHSVQSTLSLTHSYHLWTRRYMINLYSFWFYATLFKWESISQWKKTSRPIENHEMGESRACMWQHDVMQENGMYKKKKASDISEVQPHILVNNCVQIKCS